ncbi:hypothetical protein [Mycobacterium sp. DL99]|uniref:hypothetical protein n=1 Tax=Mycobacterium sp. DL99 TaxID=2528957 RepID=UPI00108221CA|nr:hypothetical protein [Mycobacterium sp. DL99]
MTKQPRPTPDALVALRNARLWEAQAQLDSGAERNQALQAASQWAAAYQAQMQTPTGKRWVPLRRGAQDLTRLKVRDYLQMALMSALVLGPLGMIVWRLLT